MSVLKLISILSCIAKCIRITSIVIKKKLIFTLIIFILTASCTSPTALLGPAYTLTSSGNVLQASLSYGSGELVKQYTGKTTIENLKEISIKNKNIKKNTLQSEEFYNLVKEQIQKTNKIINLSNQ